MFTAVGATKVVMAAATSDSMPDTYNQPKVLFAPMHLLSEW